MVDSSKRFVVLFLIFSTSTTLALALVVYVYFIKERGHCERFGQQYPISTIDYAKNGSSDPIYCINNANKLGFHVIGRVSPSTTRFDAFRKLMYAPQGTVRVAHDGPTALYLFHMLCRCYNVPMGAFVYIDLPKKDFVSSKWGNESIDLYAFLHMHSLGDRYWLSLQDKLFYNVAYDDIDMDKVHVFIPYAYTETVDMKLLMPKKTMMQQVHKILTFDTLKVAKKDMTPTDHDNMIQECISSDIDSRTVTDMFRYHNYPGFNFVETFQNNVVLQATKNVPGRLQADDNGYKAFKLYGNTLNGVRLEPGDRVMLANQNYKEENGVYYVLEVSVDTFLHSSIPIPSSIVSSTGTIHVNDLPRFAAVYDRLYIHDKGYFATILEKDKQGSKFKVEIHKPINTRIVDGACVTDAQQKTRIQCESKYDMFGKPKKTADVWDAPCKTNTDCPFYQRSPPYRGGCTNGYCEMPLGVRRIGWTRYAEGSTSFPWCYGCTVYNMDTCCAQQETPAYAFARDKRSEFVPSGTMQTDMSR